MATFLGLAASIPSTISHLWSQPCHVRQCSWQYVDAVLTLLRSFIKHNRSARIYIYTNTSSESAAAVIKISCFAMLSKNTPSMQVSRCKTNQLFCHISMFNSILYAVDILWSVINSLTWNTCSFQISVFFQSRSSILRPGTLHRNLLPL